jgi:hypothetical protein
VEQSVPRDDPDPKALACYGLLVRWRPTEGPPKEQVWLRFVDGHPVSEVPTALPAWSCAKLQCLGKKVLLLVWDNASSHISNHNRRVKRERKGVHVLACFLPIKSPWLNPIEP